MARKIMEESEIDRARDTGTGMSKPKRDPRTDKAATLEDFVRRVNRMGFPQAQRVEYPIWTREDIKWAAVETEKLFKDLKELGWGREDLDPVSRVVHARLAIIRKAHAMSHRTNNMAAKKIIKKLPRIEG
jgi:hypothetical protein